jgi:hypothetical protein
MHHVSWIFKYDLPETSESEPWLAYPDQPLGELSLTENSDLGRKTG